MEDNQPKDQQTSSVNPDANASSANENKLFHRGRPRKLGKLKVSHPIVATGKGRGRPKKPPVSADEIRDDAVAERAFPVRQSKTGSRVEARGRPRKEKVCSDSEDCRYRYSSLCMLKFKQFVWPLVPSYDEKPEYEERRPVGRPSAGAVNLNIVRTGHGQGRPRKLIQPNQPLSKQRQSNDTEAVRKRGRPRKGGVPYERTGKPRGRPQLYKTTLHNSSAKTPEENHQSDGEVDVG